MGARNLENSFAALVMAVIASMQVIGARSDYNNDRYDPSENISFSSLVLPNT